jgi:hypothetical protein
MTDPFGLVTKEKKKEEYNTETLRTPRVRREEWDRASW